jgi:hypothetical protein
VVAVLTALVVVGLGLLSDVVGAARSGDAPGEAPLSVQSPSPNGQDAGRQITHGHDGLNW